MIQSPSRICHQTSGSLSASRPTPPVRMMTPASNAWRGSESHATTRLYRERAGGGTAVGVARTSVAMRAQRRGGACAKTDRGRLATDSYTPRDGHRDAVSEAPADVGKHQLAASADPGRRLD